MMHSQSTITPPAQSTECLIGSDLLGNLHTLSVLKTHSYDRFLLISDDTVYDRFGRIVRESLMKLGKPVTPSVIPEGEGSKRFETITSAVRPFFDQGITRRSCLVALGGGMITDLGGFIANILLRGIDCIYLPTTLLAQIDAAIGGKTGVDFWLDPHHMYKNMIGTIRQPTAVISDTDTLKTLPASEITNGLGEMVKYWIGWGRPTIEELMTVQSLIVETQNVASLQNIISACQDIKLDIVQQDTFETKGIRQQLNLGHTIGHAVESAAEGKFSHGQAVAIGCVAAAKISVAMSMLDQSVCDRIERTIASLGLPTKAGSIAVDGILDRMRLDKKGGMFVLIRDIGKLETEIKVDTADVRRVVTQIIS